MPASSEAQRKFMCMLANNPQRREKEGISQEAAMEFCRMPVKKDKKKSQK